MASDADAQEKELFANIETLRATRKTELGAAAEERDAAVASLNADIASLKDELAAAAATAKSATTIDSAREVRRCRLTVYKPMLQALIEFQRFNLSYASNRCCQIQHVVNCFHDLLSYSICAATSRRSCAPCWTQQLPNRRRWSVPYPHRRSRSR